MDAVLKHFEFWPRRLNESLLFIRCWVAGKRLNKPLLFLEAWEPSLKALWVIFHRL